MMMVNSAGVTNLFGLRVCDERPAAGLAVSDDLTESFGDSLCLLGRKSYLLILEPSESFFLSLDGIGLLMGVPSVQRMLPAQTAPN